MSPCHTAPHLCIFLSLAGTLPCPSALFSCNLLSVYICFCFLSHSQPRHHVYLLCLLNHLLLKQKQSAFFPTLYLPQHPSECYPRGSGRSMSVPTSLHFFLTPQPFLLPVILHPQLICYTKLISL